MEAKHKTKQEIKMKTSSKYKVITKNNTAFSEHLGPERSQSDNITRSFIYYSSDFEKKEEIHNVHVHGTCRKEKIY